MESAQQAMVVGKELARDDSVREFLEHAGYRVLPVESESDAAQALLGSAAELAFVLVETDHADARFELIASLRAARPNCAVVCVTAIHSLEYAVAALRAGACDHLAFPVERDALLATLERVRERKERWDGLVTDTILVLEDHEPTRRRLVDVLRKEGYQVLSAGDGTQGIEVMETRRVDLLLADVRMPGLDGLGVLREVKARQWDLEVILATAYGDHDVVVTAMRDGVIDFMRKPIDIDDLLRAVQRALALGRARRGWALAERGARES